MKKWMIWGVFPLFLETPICQLLELLDLSNASVFPTNAEFSVPESSDWV